MGGAPVHRKKTGDREMEFQMLLEEAAVVLEKPRALTRAQKRADVVLWEIAVKLSFVEWSVEDAARFLGCRECVLRTLLDFMSNSGCGRISVFWMPRDTFMISVSEFASEGDGDLPF